jgi:hypothetical protein
VFSVRITDVPSSRRHALSQGVRVSADSAIEWTHGHIGLTPRTTTDYQTDRALGWTVLATGIATRFTIDSTGHGMFVKLREGPKIMRTLMRLVRRQ